MQIYYIKKDSRISNNCYSFQIDISNYNFEYLWHLGIKYRRE